jgi:hypothetical protein
VAVEEVADLDEGVLGLALGVPVLLARGRTRGPRSDPRVEHLVERRQSLPSG